jgi:hypothetical protein
MEQKNTVWFNFADDVTIEIPADAPCRYRESQVEPFIMRFISDINENKTCAVFYDNKWEQGMKVPHPLTIHLAVDVRISGNYEIYKILTLIHEALNRNVDAIPGVIDFPKVGIAPDKSE